MVNVHISLLTITCAIYIILCSQTLTGLGLRIAGAKEAILSRVTCILDQIIIVSFGLYEKYMNQHMGDESLYVNVR